MPDDYKGYPLLHYGMDFGLAGIAVTILESHTEGDIYVIDKAELDRVFLRAEPKFIDDYKTAGGYRDFTRQARIYHELAFGLGQEPEHVALKRRADRAMERVLDSRDPFGRRWWRDLWEAIRYGWKATGLRAAHPERMVPKPPTGIGRITGVV